MNPMRWSLLEGGCWAEGVRLDQRCNGKSGGADGAGYYLILWNGVLCGLPLAAFNPGCRTGDVEF